MTKITLDFLRQVQGARWQIESASQDAVIARCPQEGCGMRSRLRPGGHMPERGEPDYTGDVVVQSPEQARNVMIARRKDLCLTVREIEDLSGLTVDHVAKIEAEIRLNPQLDTLITLANTCGFDVVLRPMPLPTAVLRVLADTRNVEPRRVRRFKGKRKVG